MDNFVSYLDSKSKQTVDYSQLIDIINASNVDFYTKSLYDTEYTGIYDPKYMYYNHFSNSVSSLVEGKKKLRSRTMSNYDEWQNEHLTEPTHSDLELKHIDVSACCISDLIKTIDENPYDAKCRYNIDLRSLHKIREELGDIDSMIGMENLKLSVFDQLLYFIQKLHVSSNKKEHDFKHTVIYGPPGTGKTEIAKTIGKMYSKLGLLKNDVFRKVTRDDLVAGYLGQTALKVKKVIDECGCLFIDEAYSLANNSNDTDSFSKECIDTICEALSDRKADLMVIVAGYENELEETFFKVNRGMKSRFMWKFKIDNYTPSELCSIFYKKVGDAEWIIDASNSINDDWFKSKMESFEFFGRDIEVLFSHIKICHSRRIFGKSDSKTIKIITIDDMNSGYDKFKQHMKSKHKDNFDIPGFYI